MPPIDQSNSIETYRLVEPEEEVEEFLKENQISAYNNLIWQEDKNALEDLKYDDSIVIKPADTGGVTVVMNKTDIKECLRYLVVLWCQMSDNPTQVFKCAIFEWIITTRWNFLELIKKTLNFQLFPHFILYHLKSIKVWNYLRADW